MRIYYAYCNNCKKLIPLFIIFFCYINLKGQPYEWNWFNHGAGIGDGVGLNAAFSIVTDNHDNVYAIGSVDAPFDYTPDQKIVYFTDTSIMLSYHAEIALIKYDTSGHIKWVCQGGGPNPDVGYSVVINKESVDSFIYITGMLGGGNIKFGIPPNDTLFILNFDNFCFIAKYDINGNFKWIRTGGSSLDDRGLVITNDNDGNIVIAGIFSGVLNFGSTSVTSYGSKDIFIAKFDTNGILLWLKNAGGVNWNLPTSIICNNNNEIIITGRFFQSITFDNQTITSAGSSDLFLAKYDTNGNLLWLRQGGGVLNDIGHSVKLYNDTIFVKGEFQGTIFFGADSFTTSYSGINSQSFFAKYLEDGSFLELIKYGKSAPTEEDKECSLDINQQGKIIVAGLFKDTSVLGNDTLITPNTNYPGIYITELTSNGEIKWAKAIYSTNPNAYCVVYDSQNNVKLCGNFGNYAAIEDTIFGGYGMQHDLFVTEIKAIYPKAGFVCTTNNLQVTFINASLHAYNYEWDFGDGSNSTLQNPTHLYTNSGVYPVSLTAINGNGSDTFIDNIIVTSDVSEITKNDLLLIYPNPTSGKLLIFTKEPGTIELCTFQCKQIIFIDNFGKNQLELDLKQYPAGIYYIKFKTEKNTIINKFVKLK
jgi:PKD repeat protein